MIMSYSYLSFASYGLAIGIGRGCILKRYLLNITLQDGNAVGHHQTGTEVAEDDTARLIGTCSICQDGTIGLPIEGYHGFHRAKRRYGYRFAGLLLGLHLQIDVSTRNKQEAQEHCKVGKHNQQYQDESCDYHSYITEAMTIGFVHSRFSQMFNQGKVTESFPNRKEYRQVFSVLWQMSVKSVLGRA